MVAPLVATRPGATAGQRDERTLRARLATTPGILRGASILLTLGLLVLAIAASSIANSRADATAEVRDRALPELATAADLYASLADADATSSTTFLSTGVEPRAAHRRFLLDLRRAGRALGDVSEMIGSSEVERRAGDEDRAGAAAVRRLHRGSSGQRPSAAAGRGRIPAQCVFAHAERPVAGGGRPVPQRRASTPRTRTDPGRRPVSSSHSRRSACCSWRRSSACRCSLPGAPDAVLNVGLVVATLLVVVLVGWSLVTFARQQDSLVHAQRDGSDGVLVLSTARILTLQAEANEGLALIEQGTGATYRERFDATVARLGGDDGRHGLLGDAEQLVPSTTHEQLATLQDRFAAMIATHRAVVELDDRGEHAAAVERSLDEELPALRSLDEGLQIETAAAQRAVRRRRSPTRTMASVCSRSRSHCSSSRARRSRCSGCSGGSRSTGDRPRPSSCLSAGRRAPARGLLVVVRHRAGEDRARARPVDDPSQPQPTSTARPTTLRCHREPPPAGGDAPAGRHARGHVHARDPGPRPTRRRRRREHALLRRPEPHVG